MYTKTHGHQLSVNNLYAEEKTAIHANSFLHGLNICTTPFTTYYQKEIISLEKFRSYQLFRKNCETFPPRTICNIRYMIEMHSFNVCNPIFCLSMHVFNPHLPL